jgi:hypothetical protein
MEHVVADPDERRHLWQWLAYPLQHRGERINHAVVIWSRTRGVGKTAIGKIAASLHGEHNYSQIKQAGLESPFNGWKLYKTLVMVEEIHGETVQEKKRFIN